MSSGPTNPETGTTNARVELSPRSRPGAARRVIFHRPEFQPFTLTESSLL